MTQMLGHDVFNIRWRSKLNAVCGNLMLRIKPLLHVPPFQPLWKGSDVLLIAGATIVFAYIGLQAIESGVPHLSGMPSQSLRALVTILAGSLEVVAIGIAVYVLGLARRRFSWLQIGMHPAPRVWLRVSAVLACIAFFLSDYVAVVVSRTFGQSTVNPQIQYYSPAGENWLSAAAVLVLSGFAVPVVEEILFRGVLYNWLRGRWGILASVLVSSLIFGVAHRDLTVGAGAFALGVVSALAYEGSRSLYPSIFIHAVNNTLKLAFIFTVASRLHT